MIYYKMLAQTKISLKRTPELKLAHVLGELVDNSTLPSQPWVKDEYFCPFIRREIAGFAVDVCPVDGTVSVYQKLEVPEKAEVIERTFRPWKSYGATSPAIIEKKLYRILNTNVENDARGTIKMIPIHQGDPTPFVVEVQWFAEIKWKKHEAI